MAAPAANLGSRIGRQGRRTARASGIHSNWRGAMRRMAHGKEPQLGPIFVFWRSSTPGARILLESITHDRSCMQLVTVR